MHMPIFYYRMAELVYKSMGDGLSQEERIELEQFLANAKKQKLFEELNDPDFLFAALKHRWEMETKADAALEKLLATRPFAQRSLLARYKKAIAIAAVTIAACGLTWLYYATRETYGEPVTETRPLPQRKSHTLFAGLRPGIVTMDDTPNGIIDFLGYQPIVKNDSQLIYPAMNFIGEPVSGSITTLRKGFYQVYLPDGSKVWLNSASSIRFTMGIEQTRNVSIEGEAFFSVVKNAANPFTILVWNELEIQAIGTRFNVVAYNKEDVKTTLVDGKLRLKGKKQEAILTAGQKAIYTKEGKIQKIQDTNAIVKATGLTEGIFVFREDDLKTIMEELGRWYGYTVKYECLIPEEKFMAAFPRSASLTTKILPYLETQTRLRFTITDDHTIIVRQK